MPRPLGRSTRVHPATGQDLFNRGATDYFVNERHAGTSERFATPKFVGEAVGTVVRLARDHFEVNTLNALNTPDANAPLHNGDGLAYFDAVQANSSACASIVPRHCRGRNPEALSDAQRRPTAGRPGARHDDLPQPRTIIRAPAREAVGATPHRGRPVPCDKRRWTRADDHRRAWHLRRGAGRARASTPARDAEQALRTLRDNLGKPLRDRPGATIELVLDEPFFVAASVINALRRSAVDALDAARQAAYQRPPRWAAVEPPAMPPRRYAVLPG